MDKHYIGLERNRPASSFCVDVNYHEGYMVLVCVGDEELPKPIWLMKTFFSPNVFELARTFVKLNWNIAI